MPPLSLSEPVPLPHYFTLAAYTLYKHNQLSRSNIINAASNILAGGGGKELFSSANCFFPPVKTKIPNAFCSKISGDFPIENKQDKVEQIRILLRNYGLSDIQISTISQMHPKVFRFHPQNVILPKLKFLSSIGLSSDILHKIIVNNPWLLQRSLENKLIPCYNLLKNVPISNKDIVRIIKRNSRILGTNVEKIAANVDAFRQMGVPQSSISFVMVNHPSLVLLNCEKLKRCVEETLSLGFNRLNTLFVQAVYVLCGSSKETWENKVKV
ncbi:transcription termination factor MTERF15, mitochondrial isoform X1 [Olea europaea subsp. europaea]|uniref:Transcription termination factor MTERF15, mitochondrial isoform X1 n=1 Tax=Olea europaea subsp. europaea TaxID=158383 RepID=A0A8S0SJR8_OLEEU|nr:transcription termination factor MTERF15, mitochondrial isoform X1 [Olea europaea subsp. europaea]